MDIFPQDLGPQTCARILQIRMAQGDSISPQKAVGVLIGSEAIPTPPMPLSSAQLVRLAVPGACICGAVGVGVAASLTFLFSGSLLDGVGLGILFGLSGGVLSFLAGVGKRVRFYRKEINDVEIAFAGKSSHEPLTTEYWTTIKMLIAVQPSCNALTEQDIRKALRSLGEAIERLPPQPTVHLMVDATTLTKDASRLTEKGWSETDPVVAASLTRQAEALTRRANTVARTATLVRRNQILRDEVAAQVKAFQTSLAAAQINGSESSGDFAALAESIGQVAQEANALADAQEELEVALNPARTTSPQGSTEIYQSLF